MLFLSSVYLISEQNQLPEVLHVCVWWLFSHATFLICSAQQIAQQVQARGWERLQDANTCCGSLSRNGAVPDAIDTPGSGLIPHGLSRTRVQTSYFRCLHSQIQHKSKVLVYV